MTGFFGRVRVSVQRLAAIRRRLLFTNKFISTDKLPMLNLFRQTERRAAVARIAILFVIGFVIGSTASAQQALPQTKQQPTIQRQLAEGIVTVVPSDPREAETFQGPLPMVELTTGRTNLDWKPPTFPDSKPFYTPSTATLKTMASRVVLRHRIWNIEFAFKPMRLVEVEIPQTSGKMQVKPIWYMVYRATYRGNELSPSPKPPDARASIDEDTEGWRFQLFPDSELVNSPHVRFFPHFVLESRKFKKEYLDHVIPAAKRPILLREFPSKTPGVPEIPAEHFYNTVEMCSVPLLLTDGQKDNGVWGFVTWEDVDPRIDFYSIYIRGLTNAFRFQDQPGVYKEGDPPATGRRYAHKTLKLNFYRPGDTKFPHEKEFQFGVPVVNGDEQQKQILDEYGVTDRLDYLWLYR